MTKDPNPSSSSTQRPLRGALAAGGALTLAFVMAPSFTVSPPSAAPARNGVVTPTVKHVALKTQKVRSVTASGPSTRVIAAPSAPRTSDGAVVDSTGKAATAARPAALAAGQSDDNVVEVAASGDLVGLTWPTDTTLASKATVAVRVLTDKGWQDWQELTVDDRGDASAHRIGTEPIFVDGAQRVQIRVAPEAKDLLKTAQLAAITSPTTAADAQLTPTAIPGAANAAYVPSVISRAGWGANERLRNGCVPTIRPTTKVIVVHHTAGSNNYTAAQSASIIRGIYAYDTGTLGWCDVAYNMIVDKYGQRFEGRFGGLNKTVQGAHADSFNQATFGISILGNYDTTSVPAAGMTALKQGIAMRLSQFYIKPYGQTTLYSEYNGTTSKYPKGSAYLANNIAGHRDSSNTACPGRYLYPRLNELRDGAAALAGYSNGTFSSPIYKRYVATGGAAKWGLVNVGESALSSSVKRTVFTSNQRIYATPRGTAIVGPGIDAAWSRFGGLDGVGYAINDETKAPGGWYVPYSKGNSVTWTTNNQPAYLSGGLHAYWWQTGGPQRSPLQLPIATGQAVRGGWLQSFQNGTVMVNYAGRGFSTSGAINAAYFAAGGPNGSLGMPTSEGYQVASGVRRQWFQNGYIDERTATGTASIHRS